MLNQDVENFITSAEKLEEKIMTQHNTTLLVKALHDEDLTTQDIAEIMDHSLEWVLKHLYEDCED